MCWKCLSFRATMSKKWRFPLWFFSVMWPNPQEPADLVTFTEEIPNGKFYFYAVRAAVQAAVLTNKLALNLGIFYTSKAKYAGIRYYYHYVKYARIRGFVDPYFPVWDQYRRFCPKIRVSGNLYSHILYTVYFIFWKKIFWLEHSFVLKLLIIRKIGVCSVS